MTESRGVSKEHPEAFPRIDSGTSLGALEPVAPVPRLATTAGPADVELRMLRARVHRQEDLVLKLSHLLRDRNLREQEQERQMTAAMEALRECEATIAALKTSTSWRLTAPLRLLKRSWRGAAPPSEAGAADPRAGDDGIGQARAEIEATRLFDIGFYLEQTPHAALDGIDPIEHFIRFGAKEGRNPHPLFDTRFYRAQEPPLAADVNPLLHYFAEGARARRDPSPVFSTGFYLDANPDVRRAGINPLRHFVEQGLLEGRWPRPDLDPARARELIAEGHSEREAVRLLAALAESACDPQQAQREAKRAWRAEAEERLRSFLQGRSRLALPAAERPRVSVVIVLYNQAALTLGCLGSLAPAAAEMDTEILLVDNGSSDATRSILERLDGARILRNRENRGYAAAVNQAARLARGEYILLLNNDSLPLPGAIPAAVAAVEGDGRIAGAGGRIILADGRLQEAGCIVWRDGSCQGYGRGGDPDAGEYRFRREVDFCSGVFLLLRRSALEEAGGLDESFSPAYYEDADLCLRLRQHWYRILYEPEAVVRHWEFASSGGEDQAVQLQERARARFLAKHGDRLAGRAAPGAESQLWARMAEPEGGRVLLVDDAAPYPWLGSGFPRSAEMIRAIRNNGSFLTLYTTAGWDSNRAALKAAVPPEVEVITGSRLALPRFLAARRGYYDTIIVSRPHNMQAFNCYAEASPEALAGAHVVYDAEALYCMREIRQRSVAGEPLPPGTAERMIAEETALAARASDVLVVNETEAAHFRGRVSAQVTRLGYAVPSRPGHAPFAARRGFLFVGPLLEDGTPNVDAVAWFAAAVLPRIRERIGEVALEVAGVHRSLRIGAIRDPGFRLLGFVADLPGLYDQCRVFVAPTRYSAGIPLKVIEAGAHGVPAVATPLLAAQLGWQDGRELLVGEDAEGFAAACIRLHEDGELWARLREGVLARIAADHAPGDFTRALGGILRRRG